LQHVRTLIFGGGLTGLSTAYHLDKTAESSGDASLGSYLLVEQDTRLGGLTRTEFIDGYGFDHTGHWLHLRHPEMKAFVHDVMGDDMMQVARKSRIWSSGMLTHFPFQANLFGLPKQVQYDCLQGAIEAALAQARGEFGPPANFKEYCLQHFGKGITDAFMVPYNTKLWGCEPEEITADWCSRFLPRPNIAQMTAGALGLHDPEAGYNAHFVYPREGGIEAFASRIAAHVPKAKVALEARTCTLSSGQVVQYERLVSSIPLPELCKLATSLPSAVTEAVGRLRCTSLRYLVYGIARPVLDDIQWLYVPEPRYPFYRIGSFSNAVASLAPAGKSSLYVEVANNVQVSDADVKASVREFLRERGWLDTDAQVEVEQVRHIRYGYVIFDDHYFPAKATIFPYLQGLGVHSLGRYGAWVYSSMEDALWDGFTYARQLAG
jgi:protoporphyrinogen oxidase